MEWTKERGDGAGFDIHSFHAALLVSQMRPGAGVHACPRIQRIIGGRGGFSCWSGAGCSGFPTIEARQEGQAEEVAEHGAAAVADQGSGIIAERRSGDDAEPGKPEGRSAI